MAKNETNFMTNAPIFAKRTPAEKYIIEKRRNRIMRNCKKLNAHELFEESEKAYENKMAAEAFKKKKKSVNK